MFLLYKTLSQLERRLKSSLFASVRVGFNTARLAEIYNARTKETGKNAKLVTHISLMDLGGQSTMSGCGEIYENFKKSGLLTKFTGYGEKAASFYDPTFETAPLRELNLDETYYGMDYDCRSSKILRIILLRIRNISPF